MTTPLRQFRITINEDGEAGATHAHLSWRTFPCSATHWDGSLWCTIQEPGPLPVTSQEALRAVLAALVDQPWIEARYPRPRRP